MFLYATDFSSPLPHWGQIRDLIQPVKISEWVKYSMTVEVGGTGQWIASGGCTYWEQIEKETNGVTNLGSPSTWLLKGV